MSEHGADYDAPPMCLWLHRGIHRVNGVRRCRRRSCVGYHPRRGLFERLTDRWLARRFDHERGYDQPLWWRAREMRRLSVGAPIITRQVKRTCLTPPEQCSP